MVNAVKLRQQILALRASADEMRADISFAMDSDIDDREQQRLLTIAERALNQASALVFLLGGTTVASTEPDDQSR